MSNKKIGSLIVVVMCVLVIVLGLGLLSYGTGYGAGFRDGLEDEAEWHALIKRGLEESLVQDYEAISIISDGIRLEYICDVRWGKSECYLIGEGIVTKDPEVKNARGFINNLNQN